MSESARVEASARKEDPYELAQELVALGESRAATDLIRHEVNTARLQHASSLPFLRLLAQYAGILESADALAEAEFVRTEAVELVESAKVNAEEAVDAFLKYGSLLCKMHNYDGAVARLRETIRRADLVDTFDPLRREIVLAHAWRGQAQAFEALGELSQASNALDELQNVKRQLRFLVFSRSREG